MQEVELKPWRNGLLNELLLVLPPEGSWDELMARTTAHLDARKSSNTGRGPQVTLVLGNRAISPEEMEALVQRLKSVYEMLPVAVVTSDMGTQAAARLLTLNVYLMVPGSSQEPASDPVATNSALYIPNTVRSGQRVVHTGHIVVGGDVNAGAEVIATGDILIFGTLRGLAHAGSQGDEHARIIAGNMRPQQIRIATKIARAPEEGGLPAGGARRPEAAGIRDGEIQVFPV